jgi:hypothetical protein
MLDDKITLESGRFDWEAGRGYETPADGGRTLPPGWGDPPEFKERSSPLPVRPRGGPLPDVHVETPIAIGNPDIATIAAALQAEGEAAGRFLLSVPSERVNLDTGTAVFRGHEITLSDDGRAAIKTILAMEVCRVLDEEKARVLKELGIGAMFDQEVPGDAGGGAENVPEMPEPAESVEPEAQRDSGEVQ